jgi:hypothetical protein
LPVTRQVAGVVMDIFSKKKPQQRAPITERDA